MSDLEAFLLNGHAEQIRAYYAMKWHYDVIQMSIFFGAVLIAGVICYLFVREFNRHEESYRNR